MLSAALSTCILLLTQDPVTPERWVKDLSSESVELRGKAREALLNLGATARPALKSAAEGEDVEAALQAKALLRELERRERRRALWSLDRRIALDLKDVRLDAALAAVFRDFVGDAVLRERMPMAPEAAERRVSLRISGASFWESFDAVCSAGRVRPIYEALVHGAMGPLADAEGPKPVVSGKDVRAWLTAVPLPSEGVEIRVGVALPPGCVPAAAPIVEIEVLDAQRRRVEARAVLWTDQPRYDAQRAAALPFVAYCARLRLPQKALEGTFSARGKITIAHAKDADRVEVNLLQERPPIAKKIGALTITLGALEGSASGWKEALSWTEEKGPEDLFAGWFEDAAGGRRLFSYRMEGGFEAQGTFRSDGKEPAAGLARWIIARGIGRETVEAPFAFDALTLDLLLGRR